MSETRREVAESIARRGVPYSWLNNEDDYRAALNWFANEIEAALKDRDERAVEITTDILPIGADNCYWCERVRRAVAAIRTDT